MPAPAQIATGAGTRELIALESERPELLPWLRPLQVAFAALQLEPWLSLKPIISASRTSAEPVLHGAVVHIDSNVVCNHVWAVLQTALDTTIGSIDHVTLLEAAIAHDAERVAHCAEAAGLDPAAIAAAAQLAAFTLLQSCRRSVAVLNAGHWSHSYCPACGALPSMAEVLGLERTRKLRCARCGASWTTHVLLCVFCGERDHQRLGSLVPEGTAGQLAWVETCSTCKSYLKVRAALRPTAPELVIIEDARTLELDLAAAEHGYQRSEHGSYAVQLEIKPAITV